MKIRLALSSVFRYGDMTGSFDQKKKKKSHQRFGTVLYGGLAGRQPARTVNQGFSLSGGSLPARHATGPKEPLFLLGETRSGR